MADYYVRNGGNDNNNGLSIANAWATVGKVVSSQFSPLDVVQFKCGDIWRERLTVAQSRHSGLNKDNPVLFTSYGIGSRPIISGAEIEGNWTREGDYFYASDYPNNPGVVVKNGWLLKRRENKADIDDDAWWYDAGNNRVYIRFDPALGRTMEIGNYSRRWVLYVNSNVHDVKIDDICLRDGCRGPYVYASASDITLQNLTVKNLADWGVNISPKTNLLGCDISYIHDPGVKQSGVTGDAYGYMIADNEISWCGYYMSTYCQGSAIVYNHSNILIELNDIHHCGLGYTQSWGMDHGLKLGCEGGIVRFNNVHHNTAGIGIIAGASNMNVHHNLTWMNAIGIAHAYASTGTKINNNVLFKNQHPHGDSCGFLINDGIVKEFKNNILFKNGNPPHSKQIWFRMSGTDDIIDCDYNLIYGPDDPNADICKRVTGFTWAEWQAAGYDLHSKNIPYHGMIDPNNGDFNLMPASPCINAGVDVGLEFDYIGTHIPQGIYPDIGAYEYKQNGGGISMAIVKLIITEPPSFEVIGTPGERIVQKGEESFYTITLDTVGGYDRAVALSLNNIPDGVTAAFSLALIVPGESSVLTVQVGSDAIAGEYEMEVVGVES